MVISRRRRRALRRRQRQRWLAVLLASALLVGLGFWQPQWALQAEFARQRWLAGAEQHSVEVAGHRWSYLQTGDGPPLLLIHGFTGSKENWLPVMAALGERYRVIAPDLPGWGDSERRAGQRYGFVEQAQHLAAFVDLTTRGEPVRLVGHSMGGGIAALWAANAPARLQQLVLLDSAGVPFDNAFARAVRDGEHPFAVTDAASLRHQINLVFKQPPWIPWPADRALIAQRAAQQPFEREVLQAIAGDQSAAFAPGEAARRIRVPTLLLWCREDRVIDASAAAEYARRIPGSRVEWLADCNHMPMMEQPQATAQRLLEFLASP